MNPLNSRPDAQAETRPSRPTPGLETFQPIRISNQAETKPVSSHRRRPVWFFALLVIILIYFFAPLRMNFLLLGVDGGLERGDLGRTDTIILGTVNPLTGYVGILSIPRDLWVNIPGVGENRINTAYFFAEAQAEGSGPSAIANTVRENFSVSADYFVVLRMDGVVDIVDSLGGLDVKLDKPMSGYGTGEYHLDGTQALAFARSRTGSDDFARMVQGQILLKALLGKLLNPDVWMHFPRFFRAVNAAVDTNMPFWLWPRLGLAFLRAGLFGIDGRSISREMVNPFQTSQGAQVLGPNWDLINPLVDEMFR